MDVYRVLRESGVQSRFEIAVTKGLTPLVGREEEVKLLLMCWEQVKTGSGQVVLLSGEAGMGKSRLVKVLKEGLAEGSYIRLECRCSPYYQNSALYPVSDLLERTLQFQKEDSPEEKLAKLEEMLASYDVSLPEMVPLVAALLSVPVGERYAPLKLSPQRQRYKTLEALVAILLAMAKQQPVLLIMEDLHWVDPSTQEWLDLCLELVPTSQLFVLLTFRPNFSPPWGIHSHLTPLSESYGKRGQAEKGLRILDEALAAVDTTEERQWEAELHRLKGELLRQQAAGNGQKANIEAEAEACFHRALEIARHQQAKSSELRAAMSLSQLWQQQGKGEEARKMLTEIYNWFTEGFDTLDLKKARALLEELS